MSPFDECSGGYEDLKVRKQRRKSRSSTNNEPVRDINDFYPPPFLPSSSDSGVLSCCSSSNKASSRYTTPPSRMVSDSEDTPKANVVMKRDISVGAFLKAELLTPPTSIDLLRASFDQGTLLGGEGVGGSAALCLERNRDEYGLLDGNATQVIRLSRRQNAGPDLPAKKKMFSRVLSGFNLLGRSNSIIGSRSGNVQIKRVISASRGQMGNEKIRSSSETNPASLKLRSAIVPNHRPTLSESGSTNAASTGPSEPGLTSPNSVSSHAPSVTEGAGFRTLTTPLIAPLLQANLIVTPELESIDTEDSRSFWVAIEVTGDVVNPELDRTVPASAKSGLDVVLLVDLSINTSAATSISCRDVCSSVVSLLEPSTDRLAILTSYTNSPSQSKTYDAHVVLPLQPVDSQKFLKALDAVTGPDSNAMLLDSGLDHAIDAAFDVFLHSGPLGYGRDRELAGETYGHLFLISRDPPEVIDPPKGCEAVQVHLVNPSAVPWTGAQASNNGWQLDANSSQNLINPWVRSGLSSSLEAVIRHARLGISPGQLRDLVVYMEPMSNCEVEAVMGGTRHRGLSPGQRVLVFVKLSVGLHSLEPLPALALGLQDQDVQTSTHLLEQLDVILGQATTDILRVEVKYKHSLFSMDTNLSVTSTARLRRHLRHSSWDPLSGGQLSSGFENYQTRVQRHLGHFIASNHSPVQALSALEDMFGEAAALPVYFKRLREELRHRVLVGVRPNTLRRQAPLEESPTFRHSKTNGRRLNPTSGTRNLGVPVVSKELMRIPSKESVDEARRIWLEMRKRARGRESERDFSDCMPMRDENLMKIAEKALSNKRSLGADTLKSIATGRRKSGLFAPWL
ncbi:MAG: hypothetical protein M1840_007945 [Geoglossum simile]|nr:MAG: hypothetical protein M1840_007945 [Geoglossum simile]